MFHPSDPITAPHSRSSMGWGCSRGTGMGFAVLKAEGHTGKPNAGFHGSFKEQTLGRLTVGCWCHQWGASAWTDFQSKTQSHKDTVPQLTAPFSACTGNSPPGKSAGSGWSGDSPNLLPLPVIQVLFASMNCQPIPPPCKSCSKKAFVRSYC